MIAANVELKLAELDLEMYQKAPTSPRPRRSRARSRLKSKELVEAKNALEQMQGLVKKGFKSPADLRAAKEPGRQQGARARKQQARSSMVKKRYEYHPQDRPSSRPRSTSRARRSSRRRPRRKASVAKADSEYETAKATYMLEDQELKKFRDAEGQDGDQGRAGGHRRLCQRGRGTTPAGRSAKARPSIRRQKIFTLPDLTNMQVKVNIHESLIKKIKPGQTAEIRVDAFPNVVIVGKVKTVSQLADSNRGWMSGGVKEYTTVVAIEKMPKEELRPGMTAEVKILVGELNDVLVVPVQAVAEHRGKFYAFVVTPKGVERREVKAGESNDLQVQVLEGLKEGESVALDARARVAAAFKDEKEEDAKKKEPSPKATPPPGR